MIPRCKIVDCSVCGNSNVKGRKVGKKTYCFACYDNKKKEESVLQNEIHWPSIDSWPQNLRRSKK